MGYTEFNQSKWFNTHVASISEPLAVLSFIGKWVNIKHAYSKSETVPSFNHGHMLSYFVSWTAANGPLSSDIKSTQLPNICMTRHVQSNLHPWNVKNCVYKLMSCCGCPAGKGPFASCKHTGARCYTLVEFCAWGTWYNLDTCNNFIWRDAY